MEEYYVSMRNWPWRAIGDICHRKEAFKYDYIGNKSHLATTKSFNDTDEWRLATLEEANAYKLGIKNIKDIIYSKTIEIW